ncbi:autotransporter outer membrane beta-barrel domain-containing protein, partial [Salmonella enterica]
VDPLNQTSKTDENGDLNAGVFNNESNRFVQEADLTNYSNNDTRKTNYGYGVIALNSDGHLTINGTGDTYDTDQTEAGQDEVDNVGDNVSAASCNYKLRIYKATGAGYVADY